MNVGVYFCKCGGNISDKIDPEQVRALIAKTPRPSCDLRFETCDFLCSEAGKEFLEQDIRENNIARAVISACSPRDHEKTFRRVLSGAGLNPYLMQMVNLREQVAWVTAVKEAATKKAATYIGTALRRAAIHEPLEKREIEICPDVVVIGAGPAGLKTALTIAESGRKVALVEKTPVIGGLPVRYEEIFPNMECGPCVLEPLLREVLHGENSKNIELMTLSEVTSVVGSYGNFTVGITSSPRFIDIGKCIGCEECITACPVPEKNAFNCDMDMRKAISLPFSGALPNAPYIDAKACVRSRGEDCCICKNACPVEDAIVFEDQQTVTERKAGAIVVAIGSDVYDCRSLPNLGYGKLADILTGPEFERLAASNGPSEGMIRTTKGQPPKAVAIIHCVGSLDKDHKEYCSGICCGYALKFNSIIQRKLPGTAISHFFRELSLSGKEGFIQTRDAGENANSSFIRYADIKELSIKEDGGRKTIRFRDAAGRSAAADVDMVILCPAVVPSADTGKMETLMEVSRDKYGFFEELHPMTDSARSKLKGIFIAGTCQTPMDIRHAMSQGMAAAGYILSGLVAGKKLEIDPATAVVDAERCSGCNLCLGTCPYKAISFDSGKGVCSVNDVLCQGCGACAAACPSGAMDCRHFRTREILAEIEGLLE